MGTIKMQKLVNGQLIDLTPAEIAQHEADSAAWRQATIASHLPAYRYAKETGGITVNGVHIQTDRETRSTLLGARVMAVADNSYTVQWKTPEGFVTLNAAQIIAISNAVAAHVQKCYAAEATVLPTLDTLQNVTEVETAFDTAYNT